MMILYLVSSICGSIPAWTSCSTWCRLSLSYHIIVISIDAMIGMIGMTMVLLRRKGEDLLMDRIREEEEEKAA